LTDLIVSVPEIVIAYFSLDADLMTMLDSQIGTRHKFTDDRPTPAGKWSIDNAPGLTIRADAGQASKYVPEQRSNLECLSWAKNYGEALAVYSEVVRIVRDFQRVTVNGYLLLTLSLETQPTQLVDPETNYPQAMFFLYGVVGENRQV